MFKLLYVLSILKVVHMYLYNLLQLCVHHTQQGMKANEYWLNCETQQ